MQAIDWILVAIILLIIGGASAYIIKAKKSGQKCIGCPDSRTCSSQKKKEDGDSACSSCPSCSSCTSCSGCATEKKS